MVEEPPNFLGPVVVNCPCCGQGDCRDCKVFCYYQAVPYWISICFTHEYQGRPKVMMEVNPKSVWRVGKKNE